MSTSKRFFSIFFSRVSAAPRLSDFTLAGDVSNANIFVFHPRRDPGVVSNRRCGLSNQNQMQLCKKVSESGERWTKVLAN